MGYRGRKQLGSELFVGVLCTGANKKPAAPVTAPVMQVLSSSGPVGSMSLPAVDANFITGLFGYRLFLGALFAVGLYTVVYTYQIGATVYADQDTFEIIPGGDPNGAVVSLFPFLPGVNTFLIKQLDGGALVFGKNPRF